MIREYIKDDSYSSVGVGEFLTALLIVFIVSAVIWSSCYVLVTFF